MIANREEADKCSQLAQEALRKGNVERALKYAQKAHQLHPTVRTSESLEFIQNRHRSNGAADADQNGGAGPSSQPHGPRLRTPAPSSSTAEGSGLQPHVSRILKASSFYDVLGISRNATDADIKKAYRKLALLLHPDKAKGHKTEEAFKKVSQAFSCLSDPEKRQYYDATGYENRTAAVQAQAQRQQSSRQAQFFTTDEIDPEEIFNMFFGTGGWPTGGVFHTHFGPRHHHRAQQQQQARHTPADAQRNQMAVLLQLLPILLIFGYSFLSSMSQPPFSLTSDGKYYVGMATERLQVPYYIRNEHEFEQQYPSGSPKRAKLESQVEQQHLEHIFQRCQHEKLQQRRLYSWGGREQAQSMPMPNCGRLVHLKERMMETGGYEEIY